MEGLLFILFALLVVGFIIYGFYASNKRRKELAEWALGKGLTFTTGNDHAFDSRFPNFNCLRNGHDQYAYNIMQGVLDGREFIGCDYHYETGSGKNNTQHHFSLIITKSPILLKPLLIRPENILDKIAEFAGFNDIDFESAEFSRKFYVKSSDKKWAYDIIHQQTMEYLLASPAFSIQFDSLFAIVYRDRKFSTADFDAAASLINGVFERIPEYVIQNQKLHSV